MRRAPLLRVVCAAALSLSLVACSSDEGEQDVPLPNAQATPCPTGAFPESVPAECVEGPDGELPVPTPTATLPGDSAAIDPVEIPPVPNELGRADNATDPGRTSATLTVTIPKGARLRSDVTCDGSGIVIVTTSPKSGAEQDHPCAPEGEGLVLTVEDANPAPAAQAYTVTIEFTPPGRWAAVLSWTDEPID